MKSNKKHIIVSLGNFNPGKGIALALKKLGDTLLQSAKQAKYLSVSKDEMKAMMLLEQQPNKKALKEQSRKNLISVVSKPK